MKLPEPGKDFDFQIVPMGQHLAVCSRWIDLGTQQSRGIYGPKHKIVIGFEIPDVRIEYEDPTTRQMVNLPKLHSEKFTWSMSTKGRLRPFLESWRGRPFTDDDFGSFDTRNLIGVPAMIQINHRQGNDGKTYADISAIMAANIPREKWPRIEGEPIYYSIEEHDQREYEKLSDYWKNAITMSPEFQQRFGGSQGGYGGQGGYGQAQGGGYGYGGQGGGQPPRNAHQGTHGGQMASDFQNRPPGEDGFGQGQGQQQGQGHQGQGQVFDDEIPF